VELASQRQRRAEEKGVLEGAFVLVLTQSPAHAARFDINAHQVIMVEFFLRSDLWKTAEPARTEAAQAAPAVIIHELKRRYCNVFDAEHPRAVAAERAERGVFNQNTGAQREPRSRLQVTPHPGVHFSLDAVVFAIVDVVHLLG